MSDEPAPAHGFDLRVEWSPDDCAWCAVFVRDGEPWFLDGVLVGMAWSPEAAVAGLLVIAEHLIAEGTSSLTGGAVIDLDDRVWLFKLLDATSLNPDVNQAMYETLRGLGWSGL